MTRNPSQAEFRRLKSGIPEPKKVEVDVIEQADVEEEAKPKENAVKGNKKKKSKK